MNINELERRLRDFKAAQELAKGAKQTAEEEAYYTLLPIIADKLARRMNQLVPKVAPAFFKINETLLDHKANINIFWKPQSLEALKSKKHVVANKENYISGASIDTGVFMEWIATRTRRDLAGVVQEYETTAAITAWQKEEYLEIQGKLPFDEWVVPKFPGKPVPFKWLAKSTDPNLRENIYAALFEAVTEGYIYNTHEDNRRISLHGRLNLTQEMLRSSTLFSAHMNDAGGKFLTDSGKIDY